MGRLLALIACAFVTFGTSAERAVAQSNDKTTEISVRGVLFQIPKEYFSVGPAAIKSGKHFQLENGLLKGDDFSFNFWLSDSKPLWEGARKLPELSLVGARVYWPPEPGRPFLSGDDFLVRVVDVYPREAQAALDGQRRLRGGEYGPRRTIEIYGRLKCGVDRSTAVPIICTSPFDDDPVVYISGSGQIQDKEGTFSSMRMYLYSRIDGLAARIDFPGQGLTRWEEVVCKTLSLVRAWRASGDPSPDDCSKFPRLTPN